MFLHDPHTQDGSPHVRNLKDACDRVLAYKQGDLETSILVEFLMARALQDDIFSTL